MSVLDVARAHHRDRRRLALAVSGEGRRLWRQIDRSDMTSSWSPLAARVALVLASAQATAAGQADAYTDTALAEREIEAEAVGRVNPRALAGIASDGRRLDQLLLAPVIAAKAAIMRDVPLARAMAGGQAVLEMILRTQVADAGRVADGIAIAARPRIGYLRYVNPPACSRCAILAGRWYGYSTGFQRHPQCDCTMIPAPEGTRPGTLATSPRQLLEQGQIRGLSKADTRAILEDGADMNRVVNARRGMSTAAKKRMSRRAQREARLMPEQIYREARSREETVSLLRLHGYLR